MDVKRKIRWEEVQEIFDVQAKMHAGALNQACLERWGREGCKESIHVKVVQTDFSQNSNRKNEAHSVIPA